MKNPLSPEAFADWCDKQPPYKVYVYRGQCICAFAQYLTAIGIVEAHVGPDNWCGIDWSGLPVAQVLPLGVQNAVVAKPHTFGALAKRLRAVA